MNPGGRFAVPKEHGTSKMVMLSHYSGELVDVDRAQGRQVAPAEAAGDPG